MLLPVDPSRCRPSATSSDGGKELAPASSRWLGDSWGIAASGGAHDLENPRADRHARPRPPRGAARRLGAAAGPSPADRAPGTRLPRGPGSALGGVPSGDARARVRRGPDRDLRGPGRRREIRAAAGTRGRARPPQGRRHRDGGRRRRPGSATGDGDGPHRHASGDPLAGGLVASLARPGANLTGVTTLSVDLSAKGLELARELVPGASRLAILWAGAGAPMVRETEAAARALGVRLQVVGVQSAAELDGAFSMIVRERPAVLLVAPSPMFFGERRRLAELAVKHRLPTVSGQREYAEAGSQIAYGANLPELFRRAAAYVDKILKGAKPGDLPIEQPTRFELVVNLKTAKALGLSIPPSLVFRADQIIQ
ncbi:MAG: ABC transporter substrate-binding protein [Candidatus Rokubacteria bacterium]|nr:ABC transporter substrate-binding protein [Candidatus Rokubacteria bacterium]